jgi:hypothetical protein
MQNLWSELNNESSSSGTNGHVQEQPRRRRLTEQYLLSSLRDWLLHDYVVPYCRMLSASRIYRRCFWIDALGNTERSDSNILQPITSLAATLAQENRPIALHGIIFEAGSSKRKEPRAVASEQDGNHHAPTSAKIATMLPQQSGTVRTSWLEAAQATLELVDQSPATFLLNPFGHTLFTYDDLAPLYQRTAPTELCLLISDKQLMAHLVSAKNTQSGGSLSMALTALLRSDRWKSLPTNDEAIDRTIDGVIDLLITSMQRHFLSVQRIAFPVQTRPAVVETAPFTLIFATRRQDSLASMNDAVCLYRRRLHEQSHRGMLSEEWFATQQQERLAEEMQQLYQHILQQGRAQRIRRWPDLRQQLIAADFAHHTIHEYDEIMHQLLTNDDVRYQWRHKSLTGSETENDKIPTPGNEDILLWK